MTSLNSLPPLTLPPRQLKKIRISAKKWLARFFTAVATAAQHDTSLAEGNTEENLRRVASSIVQKLASRLAPCHAEASGFVALNGGILAGCTPYDLRCTLLNYGFVRAAPLGNSPASTTGKSSSSCASACLQECMLQYSSTLPFVLSNKPLQVPLLVDSRDMSVTGREASVTVLQVQISELVPFVVSALLSSRLSAVVDTSGDSEMTNFTSGTSNATNATENGAAGELSISLMVVYGAATDSLWKGGSSTSTSSAKAGCGFLYLLPCCVTAVQLCLGHIFQRPVVGIESVLQHRREIINGVAAGGGMAADAPSRIEAGCLQPRSLSLMHPRTCVSRIVPTIPGLFLVEDFLSTWEENAIWQELHEGRSQLKLEYLSRRRVAHFNRRFRYGLNCLTAEGEEVNDQPRFYRWMRERLQNSPVEDAAQSCNVHIAGDYPFHSGDYVCDQLTVNYYDYTAVESCGIATHVDSHNAFDDAILIVSLGSYTVMDFARWDTPAEVAAPVQVYLAPRSLAVLSGEARYGWTHGIAEKRTDTLSELLPTLTRGDRMSLTWRRGRTERHYKKHCPYPTLCDGE